MHYINLGIATLILVGSFLQFEKVAIFTPADLYLPWRKTGIGGAFVDIYAGFSTLL